MNILHIDSSITGSQSVSRRLSAAIVARLRSAHPDASVAYRDVVADKAMHLSGEHLAALHGGGEAADAALAMDLGHSRTYLEELLAADILVIGAPMYNFSVPSQLKGWIDRVLIPGKTFQYGASGPEGLVTGRRALIASVRGGLYGSGSPNASADHQETLLTTSLGFIGITDVTFIRAEGVAVGEAEKADAIAKAEAQIAALAA